MADLKDAQIKAEIDSIMDRVAQIMEKIGSLSIEQENIASKEESVENACCSEG